MSTFEAFSCSTRVSSSAINKQGGVRPLQSSSNGYSTRQQRTFVLVVERLVLPHQLVALRLHVLDFVVLLGEGAIKLRLEHGGVLLGLCEFSLQCFRPEHVSPYPWSVSDFCRDLSTTSCSRQQLLYGYSALRAN
jgi:hypothetical protein